MENQMNEPTFIVTVFHMNTDLLPSEKREEEGHEALALRHKLTVEFLESVAKLIYRYIEDEFQVDPTRVLFPATWPTQPDAPGQGAQVLGSDPTGTVPTPPGNSEALQPPSMGF